MHTPCAHRPDLKKGRWSKAEDDQLRALVAQGIKEWVSIAKSLPGRTSKQVFTNMHVFTYSSLL
jgi:Myb-like DNA-binding domain